ncbi:MAG: inositol monophosphatase [Leptospiraceae bacterium]|nr:inositol monophosphatase [Leptospiraceae bacterium]MDW7975548.1 inositol monophosphatase family protein [Leptospiraceae bacterium]
MSDIVLPYNLKEEVHRRLDIFEGLLPELRRILLEIQQEEDLHIQYKSSDVDLVTKADYLSESTIIHFLQTKFPMDSILTEESGRKEPIINNTNLINMVSSKFTWCIDPLDGTVNYSHRIPLYAISVGILYEDLPVGGLVFIPTFNDVYRAVYNDGAYKNHKQIHVSETSDLRKSIIVTGFPYKRDHLMKKLTSSFQKVLKNTRGLRRTGSASLDLCWLAEGRFDAHYEWNLSAWDTAAGIVIVREAGGIVINQNKKQYQPGDELLIATNKNIHVEFTKLILEDIE